MELFSALIVGTQKVEIPGTVACGCVSGVEKVGRELQGQTSFAWILILEAMCVSTLIISPRMTFPPSLGSSILDGRI